MLYRCLVHIIDSSYCGQIVGQISDWDGLAACADAWAITEIELDDATIGDIDLGYGCIVSASAIRPAAENNLIGGDE